jgi:hypothetical protein
MALTLFDDSFLDRRELPPNPPNPVQQAALVLHRVSHDAEHIPYGVSGKITINGQG